jgi:hypothetical protein
MERARGYLMGAGLMPVDGSEGGDDVDDVVDVVAEDKGADSDVSMASGT